MAEENRNRGKVEYVNPKELPTNPAFTQMVVASGPVKTVYIGMQNAVDASRTVVGKGASIRLWTRIGKNRE